MADIETIRIKDLEEVSVNDLDKMWVAVDSATPDSTNKVKLSAMAAYIGGVADGKYIPLAGSAEITGSLLPKLTDLLLGSEEHPWQGLWANSVSALAKLIIPGTSPSDPDASRIYLWADADGNYSEIPGGGGVADIYDLTLRRGSVSVGPYNLGEQAADIDLASLFAGYATESWVSSNFNNYTLPIASASTLGGVKIGSGLTIDTNGVLSFSGSVSDLATKEDVATLADGVASDSARLTTIEDWLRDFDIEDLVPSWALSSSKPGYALNEISGTDDLRAIEALTGTSGLLKKTAANTWSLDTNTYLTASNHAALTLKVGTATVGSDFNSLAAKTYTITKANLTDTIGSTTYAPYNADGYVPTTRTVNGHPLSSDVTVTKGDVGLGNVENTAISTWAGTTNITTLGTITTGTWHGSKIANAYLANSSVTINSKSVSLGGSLTLTLDDIGNGTSKTWDRIVFTDTVQTITGKKTMTNVSVTDYLAVPKIAPASPVTGDIYLWADADGNYSETSGGGGVADIYDLTLRKNGTSLGTYNLGEQAADVNISIGWNDLTPDASHRFLTDTQISTWNAKQNAISDLATIRSNASTAATAVDVQQGSGLGIDNNGHLTLDSHDAADVLELGSAAFKGYDTAVTSGSANLVTSGAVYTAVSAKYTKPTTGIPKTDLASAVQTTLTNADTAYGWGDHSQAGYLTSIPKATTSTLGGIIVGTGLSIDSSGVLSFSADLSSYATIVYADGQDAVIAEGIASISARIASIEDWFRNPSLDEITADRFNGKLSFSNVVDAPDLTAIEALTGTSGLLKKTAANTWSLVAANLDNIADGSTRKLANYLPLAGGTMTGVINSMNILPKANNTYDLGSSSKKFKDIYSSGTVFADGALAIPTSAPSNPVSGKVYFWCDTSGSYAETPQAS